MEKRIRIIIIIFIVLIITLASQNIMLMNKTSKLLGSGNGEIKYTDYLKAENVEYKETTVQASINDLLSSADTMNNKIGTDKLTTTSQNLSGAVNEINDYILNLNNKTKPKISVIKPYTNSIPDDSASGRVVSFDMALQSSKLFIRAFDENLNQIGWYYISLNKYSN